MKYKEKREREREKEKKRYGYARYDFHRGGSESSKNSTLRSSRGSFASVGNRVYALIPILTLARIFGRSGGRRAKMKGA